MDGQIRRLDAQPVTLQNYRPKPRQQVVVVTNPSAPSWVREQFIACESAGALAAEFRTTERDAK